ncbi:hypothetical protein [Mycobacterium paraintracellulare]|uniref:hypothetical protein n=1 Tax=Mycobacterium paraintracellulare TaxID=1138383 RepID=UPI0019160F5B|nr:hypothetical protein [Mycobacterium paraintracellulare]
MRFPAAVSSPQQSEGRAKIASQVVADDNERAWVQVDVTPGRLRDGPALSGGLKCLQGL